MLLALDTALDLPQTETIRCEHADEESAFRDCATRADTCLIVAPEFEDILATRCSWAEECSTWVLNPIVAATRLAANKRAFANHLQAREVPTPDIWPASPSEPLPAECFPAVYKPCDGAGSLATYFVARAADLPGSEAQALREGWQGECFLQRWAPGLAASVLILTGPNKPVALPPAAQILTNDGRFHYLGGSLPLAPLLAARATALAIRVVHTVSGLRGPVGVDLVLGEPADGSGDQVIEMNPRLTTSYVGLRRLARSNLAQAILGAATGAGVETLEWHTGAIEFGRDGSFAT